MDTNKCVSTRSVISSKSHVATVRLTYALYVMTKRTQVCDRCRVLKKGYYGSDDCCINCSVAKISCKTTARLKRKRKPDSTFQRIPNSSEIGNIEIANTQSAQKDGEVQGSFQM